MNQPIITKFEALRQDAVLWKSSRIWRNAQSPDEMAMAMQQLVELLFSISNDIKRNSYINEICESNNKSVVSNKRKEDQLTKAIEAKSRLCYKLQNKAKKSEEDEKQIQSLQLEEFKLTEELAVIESIRTRTISEKDLVKQLNLYASKIKQKQEEVKRKADFERTIKSATDAGLPAEFEGSMNDVFDALKYGIYVHDDVYYSRGGMKGDYAISNFTMKIIYHIPTNDDTSFRLISVRNVYGFDTVININTDDFVSLGSFKKILARRGDFVFKGTDSDLCRLSEFLQKDETSAQRIEVLGWNKTNKFWAWSNGLTVMHEDDSSSFLPVDNHGIVEYNGRKYFIPAKSMMYAEKEGMFVNEKKFLYSEPIEGFGFEQWASIMYKTYKHKSIAAILFYIGAIFRDIMMKKFRRYPILNLFGPPGAGKGEMYDSLMFLFGQKQDQIMLGGGSTVKGFMRKAGQLMNALFGLDEYKNNLEAKKIESIKNIYDGIGYERAQMTNDLATESTAVNSSCILLGQDMPTIEPALFMRCILLAFEEGKFSEEQRKNYTLLKEKYEPHGLGFITAELLSFRSIFERDFKDRYNAIFKQTVVDVANVEIDDRMIMNISILLTVMHLTENHLKFPFSYADAKGWLISNMTTQHSILAGNNDVAKFWSIVEGLFYRDEIFDGKDFELADGYLFIRLQQVHPLYVKEMIARRDNNYLGLPTLRHYLSLDKTIYVDDIKKRFSDGTNTMTYKLKYSKVKIDLIKMVKTAGETPSEFALRVDARESEMANPKVTAEQMSLPVTDQEALAAIDSTPF